MISKPSNKNKKIPTKKSINYPYLLIIIGSFLLYGKTIRFDFIQLDDMDYIVDAGYYFSNIQNAITGFLHSFSVKYYRPMLFNSVIFDFFFSKSNPSFYHFTNIVYHTLSCCFLFRFLCLLKYEERIAFWTSLLFMVHPLFTQAVAWIFGRNDPLAAVFIIPSLIYFLKYLENKKTSYFIAHLALFVLSLFTKETAMGIPIVCITYIFLEDNFRFLLAKKNIYIQFIIGWAGTIIPWLILRWYSLEQAIQSSNIEIFASSKVGFEAMLENAPFLSESIFKFFIPFRVSVWPVFNSINTLGGIFIFGILMFSIKKVQIPLKKTIWCLIWWLIFILPGTLVVVIYSDGTRLSDYLEHRTYIPSIAFIILINEFLKYLTVHSRESSFFKKNFSMLFSFLILFLGTITFLHTNAFKNAETYWKSATEDAPHSAQAWKMLAKPYFDKKDIKTAEIYLMKSIELNPQDPTALTHLGLEYERINNIPKAKYFFYKSIQVKPTDTEALSGLSRAYIKEKKTDSALFYIQKILILHPNNIQSLLGMGVLLLSENKKDTAQWYFQKIIRLEPNNTDALFRLGKIELMNKNYSAAEQFWIKTIQIKPQYNQAIIKLVELYLFQNKMDLVKTYYFVLKKRGIHLEKKYPQLLSLL